MYVSEKNHEHGCMQHAWLIIHGSWFYSKRMRVVSEREQRHNSSNSSSGRYVCASKCISGDDRRRARHQKWISSTTTDTDATRVKEHQGQAIETTWSTPEVSVWEREYIFAAMLSFQSNLKSDKFSKTKSFHILLSGSGPVSTKRWHAFIRAGVLQCDLGTIDAVNIGTKT